MRGETRFLDQLDSDYGDPRYFPLFRALTEYANPALFAPQAAAPVTIYADPAQCSFQFDAKSILAGAGYTLDVLGVLP